MSDAGTNRIDTFLPFGRPVGTSAPRSWVRRRTTPDNLTSPDVLSALDALTQRIEPDYDPDTVRLARKAAVFMLGRGVCARDSTASAWLGYALAALAANTVGRRSHIVFSREERSKAFADFTAPVFAAASCELGVLSQGQGGGTRRKTYQCPVVAGTVALFGADYLRDARIRKQIPTVTAWRLDRLKGQGALSRMLLDKAPDIALFDQAVTLLAENAGSSLSVSGRSKGVPEFEIADTAFGLAGQLQDGEDFALENNRVALTATGSRRLRALAGALDGRWSNTGFRETNVASALAAILLIDPTTDITNDPQTGALHLSQRAHDILGDNGIWYARRLIAGKPETEVLATIPVKRWAMKYRHIAGSGLGPHRYHKSLSDYRVAVLKNRTRSRKTRASCFAVSGVQQTVKAACETMDTLLKRGQIPVVLCAQTDTASQLQTNANGQGPPVSLMPLVASPSKIDAACILTDPSPYTIRKTLENQGTALVILDGQKHGPGLEDLIAAAGSQLHSVYWDRQDPLIKNADNVKDQISIRELLTKIAESAAERTALRDKLLSQHQRLDSLLSIAGERE